MDAGLKIDMAVEHRAHDQTSNQLHHAQLDALTALPADPDS